VPEKLKGEAAGWLTSRDLTRIRQQLNPLQSNMDSITIPAHLAAVAAAYQALEERCRALEEENRTLRLAAAPVGGAGTDSVSKVPALTARAEKAAEKAAAKAANAAAKEAAKAAKEAEKAAAKEAEKAAAKEAKAAAKEAKAAAKAAKAAEKAATAKPKTKDTTTDGDVKMVFELMSIDGNLYMVNAMKGVYELDMFTGKPGAFVGDLSNDGKSINAP
jgi:chemotaxis protein histidine kinase CheA